MQFISVAIPHFKYTENCLKMLILLQFNDYNISGKTPSPLIDIHRAAYVSLKIVTPFIVEWYDGIKTSSYRAVMQ